MQNWPVKRMSVTRIPGTGATGRVLEGGAGRAGAVSLSATEPRPPASRFSLLMVLSLILALAATIRVVTAFVFPNYIVADEVYQYLGQAHRLVFGHGAVPWEFRVGLRPWLIPGLLAGPMAVARLVDPAPAFGLAVVRVLLSFASLSVVAVATLWGERFEGRRGAWIAGLTAALWPDLWVMAPHPLESTLAAYALLPGLYLATPTDAADSLRRVAAAAALLGLAFVLRNPLAPVVAIAGIGLCRRDRRRWIVGLAAGMAPFLLVGLLDWVTWGTPFRSFWLNLVLNGIDHVGDLFGRSGPATYPVLLFLDWRWTIPVIALALWRGAPRLKVATLMAGVVLLTYLPLGHKEFRFLFPMIALIVPVVGVGLARLSREVHPMLVGAVALAGLSGMLGSPVFRAELSRFVPAARAERAAAALHPAVVASTMAVLPDDLYLGARTRLVYVRPGQRVAGADALIIPRGAKVDTRGYRRDRCFSAPFRSSILARAIPSAECLWIAPRPTGAIPGVPYGSFLSFPRIARRYTVVQRPGLKISAAR